MSEVVEACYGRGSALLEAKEYASACEELSGALDLDPTHGLALRDRGRCRQMLKQYGRALQDYDAALAVSPSADLFAERANVRYLSGDNCGAAADCDESITMSPNSAAYHTRARLRAESGEKSDAAEDYAAATHLEDEAREAFVGGTVSILDQLAEMRVDGGRERSRRKQSVARCVSLSTSAMRRTSQTSTNANFEGST